MVLCWCVVCMCCWLVCCWLLVDCVLLVYVGVGMLIVLVVGYIVMFDD